MNEITSQSRQKSGELRRVYSSSLVGTREHACDAEDAPEPVIDREAQVAAPVVQRTA